MTPNPSSQPQGAAFSASKLASLLRMLADREGNGEIPPEDAASIEQIEANLARYRETSQPLRS